MEKRLIAVLSVGLVAALIVIAYQAGKLSGVRQNGSPAPIPPPVVEQHVASVDRQPEPPIPPPAPIPAPAPIEAPHLDTPPPSAPSVPSVPSLPAAVAHPAPPPPAPETRSSSAIASYFGKVDAIHVEGSGDPNAFAQGIIGGIQSGDFSQMDKLVNNAKLALSQATSLQPPPAAAEYHRQLVETLSESVEGLEKFRAAIAKGDLDSMTSVAQQLQSTQKKVNDLEAMRKQLLGK